MSVQEMFPGQPTITQSASGSFRNQAGSMTFALHQPNAPASFQDLQAAIVIDSGNLYEKLPRVLLSGAPGAKPWLKVPVRLAPELVGGPIATFVSTSGSISNPSRVIKYLRATSDRGVHNLGPSIVHGEATTHYHAEVVLAKLPGVYPPAQRAAVARSVARAEAYARNGEVPLDVWIDSSNLVRRVVVTEPLPGGGPGASGTIQIDFPSYGPEPAPVIPPADQVMNVQSLLHGGA